MTVPRTTGSTLSPPASDLNQFMRQLGDSRGVFEPGPYDLTDFFLESREYPPELRVLAWMRVHILRNDRRKWRAKEGQWAVWAIDSSGNTRNIGHMANDLGWTRAYALEVWRRCVALGWVYNHPDYPERLCLRGKVGPTKSTPSPKNKSSIPFSLEFLSKCVEDGEEGCTRFFASSYFSHSKGLRPDYLAQRVKGLPVEPRAAAMRALLALAQWEARVSADVEAAKRAVFEDHETATFARIGVVKRVNKKRRDFSSPTVKLEVMIEPGVQRPEEDASTGISLNGIMQQTVTNLRQTISCEP